LATNAPAPLVSVVIIFLNPGARYLDEAIASVRSQTLAEWELLLVDDGSTDDSSAAARAAAAADPARISYLEHPGHENRGMSASRNLGITTARGRYLAFLDADDVYLPERLAHQVAILEAHSEVGMVYGPTLVWHSWQEGVDALDEQPPLGLPTGVPLPPPVALRKLIETRGGTMPGICGLTVRRAAALEVGCFEPQFRGCYEDQVFFSKICAQETVMLTDRCLDRYRQHAASCTAVAQQTGEYREALPHPTRERYLRWLACYVAEKGLADPALDRALARDLWPYEHPLLYRSIVMPFVVLKLQARRWRKQLARRIKGQPPLPPLPMRT
jgi:glycosyltransferase involved in cell wall biosynthesis